MLNRNFCVIKVKIMRVKMNLPQFFQSKNIYYGYIVLIVGTLAVVMSIPGQTMGISVFTDYLIESFGIERNSLSLAYMIGTFSSAMFLPFAGKMLDKFGARFLGVFSAFGLTFFLLLLSVSPRFLQLFERSSYFSIIAFITVTFCFLGIRHFGQGQLTMAARTMMGLWFEKKRGLMLGISGVFVAFGFGASPLFITSLIDHYNWIVALHILAIMTGGMGVIALLMFRKSPEDCGIEIDGGKYKSDNQEIQESISFTADQAKKTFTFWAYNLGLTNQALLITAVTFHLADISRQVNLDPKQAFAIFLPVSFISVFADLIGGYLSDKIPLKYLLATQQMGLILGLLGVQSIGTTSGQVMFAVGFGISGGLFALLNGAAWPKLFGRKFLGSIVGITTSWLVAGSAIGPYLFSFVQSYFGDYRVILYASLLLPISVLIMSILVVNPRKKELLSVSKLSEQS